jgi:hypothetical protein
VAVDGAGNAFVAGGTSSTNVFPVLNPLQPAYGGSFTDGFLAKFDPGGRLLFSTFGGAGPDAINAIALDRDGNLVIAGETHSVDLPTTDDAFQLEYAGGSAFGYGDGFIAKITPDGSKLPLLLLLGGSGDEKSTGSPSTGWKHLRHRPDRLQKPAAQERPSANTRWRRQRRVHCQIRHADKSGFLNYFGGENRDEDQKIAVGSGGFIYSAVTRLDQLSRHRRCVSDEAHPDFRTPRKLGCFCDQTQTRRLSADLFDLRWRRLRRRRRGHRGRR